MTHTAGLKPILNENEENKSEKEREREKKEKHQKEKNMKLIGNVALRTETPIDDDILAYKYIFTLMLDFYFFLSLSHSLSFIETPQIPPKKETQGNQR